MVYYRGIAPRGNLKYKRFNQTLIMKFNKEKTKKFASGGKTPKEIMEEARRNQAIERSQATADVTRNSGIPAFQSQQVAINVPRPTVELTAPDITQRSDLKSMFKTRGEAFNYARKQGWNDFNWGRGRFHTKTAEEVNKVETPSDNVQDLVTETPSKQTIALPSIIHVNDSTRVARPIDPGINRDIINRPYTAPRDPGVIKAAPSGYTKRIDWGWLRRKLSGLNQGSILYQQGGQLPSYQQGGVIDNIKNWVSSLLVDPNKYQVNESTYTTYKEKTPFIGFPKETRSIVGPNGQTSTMIIKNPNTSKADTTFISPGYTKDPDLYPKFTPQDIREGNSKGRGKESYLEKFTSPIYFPHIGKHQQGGKVSNTDASQQLYVDFAVRYLKAKGISEDNMVDNEGGLKDEFLEEVSTAISEVDSPDFWEQYKSNPDATVQSYVESKMEPEQIEMARKGAKLKKLKKGGMKSKKCKCGCNLIMKKEAGGTIVEVCACGCKNK